LQSLKGKLKKLKNPLINFPNAKGVVVFQSLIGKLKNYGIPYFSKFINSFQSLTGMLNGWP